ncbi:hypothetical protein PI125_g24713 [Phytophthora idaei]|nr:hypothetical protein PI125_g24713 [Phytophthora idaei]KAG3125434.1 hypothetical protein PI126_g22765 [Phytophthora idaei]
MGLIQCNQMSQSGMVPAVTMKPAKMTITKMDTWLTGDAMLPLGHTADRKKNHMPIARFITKRITRKMTNRQKSASKLQTQ